MARAMGCVDSRSSAAARESSSAASTPAERAGRMLVTAGRPTVSVPVLSNTTLSILEAASRMSPPLISSPLNQQHSIPESSRRWGSSLLGWRHCSSAKRTSACKPTAGQTRLMPRTVWQNKHFIGEPLLMCAVKGDRRAPASALGSAHKDGCRRGQPQRTWACHHQHIAGQLRSQQECGSPATCPGGMLGYHLLTAVALLHFQPQHQQASAGQQLTMHA